MFLLAWIDLSSHRKPMGVVSRAHSWVSVWFPNISFRGLNFSPNNSSPCQHLFYFIFYFWNFDFFSSLMRLTLSNLYTFLKPKTLTFKLSLTFFQLCLGSFHFPFSSFFLKPLTYKPSQFDHSLSLKLYLSLLCSFFALSSLISTYFQVIYMVSHWIWNFRLIWIQFLLFLFY